MVFKLCAAALWGAVRKLKGAANFFRQDEILQFFYRNLLGCAAKRFWSLLECREPKSLKTTGLVGTQNFEVNPVTKDVMIIKELDTEVSFTIIFGRGLFLVIQKMII